MDTVIAILFGFLVLVFIVDAAADFTRTTRKWKVVTAIGAVALGSIGLYVAGGIDWQTKLSAYSLAVIVVGEVYLLWVLIFGSKSN
jgi:hypothetical protein